ncbi:hypothetical protein JX266_001411 [Neoarthrinium moseri]|nr:hypothetical protein JX266_001411 [Neoarthrinium moseri]
MVRWVSVAGFCVDTGSHLPEQEPEEEPEEEHSTAQHGTAPLQVRVRGQGQGQEERAARSLGGCGQQAPMPSVAVSKSKNVQGREREFRVGEERDWLHQSIPSKFRLGRSPPARELSPTTALPRSAGPLTTLDLPLPLPGAPPSALATDDRLSSATSSSSGRAERPTRALTKASSPQKSTGSASLSSEPPEDSTAATASGDDNPLLRRRSTRARDDDRDKQPKVELPEMAIASDDNEIQEDDEAVRCVCGFDDYPGLPPLDDDTKQHALKDAIDLEPLFTIELTDDLAGFFVQCDVCKVWEHGLCMGIVNEDLLPDDYYCELCRKDLHKIYTASNGQKYSIYLPLHRPSRATSRATSTAKEGARSPRSGDRKSSRASAAAAAAQSASAKRRSTMNSRDAAYDEEQLRRALEISKGDAITEEPELGPRRPKRGRDDDEEYVLLALETSGPANRGACRQPEIKRQRTTSKSPSPGDQALSASQEESEDESGLRNGTSKKSSRHVVRSQREKAERDERREEQERKRAEAANKRKGRAERRRADGNPATATTIVVKVFQADVDADADSDPSEEMPLATRASVNRSTESVHPPDPPASSQPAPDTPPADQVPASSNKKKPLPLPKKKGRNQYTKERDSHLNEGSPARSMSRDIARDKDEHHPKITHEPGPKPSSKARGGMNSKITMTDLKRRANNLMEFIGRTQVELASEPLSERNSQPASEEGSQVNGTNGDRLAGDAAATTNGTSAKDFKDLSCVEMMDALTRDLVKWQQEYIT